TLLEVVVAIFIMAVGMLALLTLFPIGMLSMARALQDQRVGDASGVAAADANAWNVRTGYGNINSAMDQPPPIASSGVPGTVVPVNPAPPTGPSYPVYIDPYGMVSGTVLGVDTPPATTPGISRQ